MSAREVVGPVHAVSCDTPGCTTEFVPTHAFDKRSAHGARVAAREAGWQVRPFSGTGSRTAHDYCPTCTRIRRIQGGAR